MLGLLSEEYVKIHHPVKKTTLIKTPVILPEVATKAKSFVIYDSQSGKVLLSKNKDEVLPLASLSKIETAYLFAKRNNIHESIKIPSLGKDHTYDFTLKPGDSWELSELIKFMLTISSNDVAEILASTDPLGRLGFIALMNDQGATSTLSFTAPSGLDVGNDIGGRGSASDMAKLIEKFYREFPYLFEATTKSKINVTIGGRLYRGVPNTNQYVESYTGISGSKTGYTEKAGGNLAILYDESFGRPLIIVILGSTKEGRFEDMQTLIDYVKVNSNKLYQVEN